MNVFLDSSALIKIYHDEEGSRNLVDFLHSGYEDLFLTIADISTLEFRSALFKKVRSNEIHERLVIEALSAFEHDSQSMRVVPISRIGIDLAKDLLHNHAPTRSLRTLDSIQLGTALYAHETGPINVFASADRRLNSISERYFPIFDPLA